MRNIHKIAVLALLLSVVSAAPTLAQDILDISPSQLVVNAIRQQKVSRTLLVRANQAINNINIIPLDLKDAEGLKVLPASAFRIEGMNESLNADGLLTAVINIDLQGVSSGRYSGELLISYENGSRQVPLTVVVKDPPYIPALVLVAGVGLGLVVSEYRSKGKPRDEILVNLGQIRTQIKIDEELQNQGKSFYNRIQAELVDVEVALEAQQWELATTSIQQARTVWNVWRRGRSDWLVQLTAYDELKKKLQNLGGTDSHYIASLMQTAEDTYRKTPTFSGPEELREQLILLYAVTNDYVDILDALNTLSTIHPDGKLQAQVYQDELRELSPDMQDEMKILKEKVEAAAHKVKHKLVAEKLNWLDEKIKSLPEDMSIALATKVDKLKQEFDSFSQEDLLLYLDFTRRVDAVISEIQQIPGMPVVNEEVLLPAFEMAVSDKQLVKGKLVNVPDITLRSISTQVLSANSRLQIFTFITYTVAVILLALAGFVELYVTRSDFGSKSVTDYFGLLAWGFGAEATRAAISDMVKSWGIVRK